MWADLEEIWWQSQRVLAQGSLSPLDGVSSFTLNMHEFEFITEVFTSMSCVLFAQIIRFNLRLFASSLIVK